MGVLSTSNKSLFFFLFRNPSMRSPLKSLAADVLGLSDKSQEEGDVDIDTQQYVLTPDFLLKVRKMAT